MAAHYNERACLRGGAQNVAELREDHFATFFRSAFGDDQHDFAFQSRDLLHLLIEIEQIQGNDFAFHSACWGGACPAHGVHVQLVARRCKQLGVGAASLPAAPELPFFGVHILEADGAHLGDAPGDGFLRFRCARDSRADVVAELRQILERVRVHHAFAGDFRERGLGTVFVRAFEALVGSRHLQARKAEAQRYDSGIR